MFHWLLVTYYYTTVHAASDISIPALIVSARSRRGYAFEDRVTRQASIESSVDSIPHISKRIADAMKVTMLGAYDVAMIMRRMRMMFGQLWALQLQGKTASRSLLKRCTVVLEKAPSQVSVILNHIVEYHKLLTTWSDSMAVMVDAQIAAVVTCLENVKTAMTYLAKHISSRANLADARFALRSALSDSIFDMLADHIHPHISSTRYTLPASDRYLFTAKLLLATEASHKHLYRVWRADQRLFTESLHALANPSWRVRGDRLSRYLVIAEASSVIQHLSKYHCFPRLQTNLGEFPFPGDREAFLNLLRQQEVCKRQAEKVAKATVEVGQTAELLQRGVCTAADIAKSEILSKKLLRFSVEQERGYREVSLLRYSYVYKGYEHYRSNS